MALILAASLNQMGGERLTADEAHAAAMRMMHADYPDAAIARELGRDIVQVRRWRNQRDTELRAQRLGLGEEVKNIPRGTLGALAGVSHDEPFVEATRLLSEVRPVEKQAREIIAEIQLAPSDEAAKDVIARYRDDLAPAGPPPRAATRSPLPVVRAAIANIVKHGDGLDRVINRAQQQDERERWTKLQAVVSKALHYIDSGQLA
jgi:hypothetical protein